MSARKFFRQDQLDEIKKAIQSAELNTSGEIRVHIETQCKGEVLDQAAYVFNKLNMQQTAERNAVLIYLAVNNRKFAIIGDAGINARVPENFWDHCKEIMLNHFREGKFTEGLCKAIQEAGLQLKQHFPYRSDDVNELPDDVSFES